MNEEKLKASLATIEYVINASSSRYYSIDIVHGPESRLVPLIPAKHKDRKTFLKKVEDVMSRTNPYAFRVSVFDQNQDGTDSLVSREIFRIAGEKPIPAFGETDVEAVQILPPRRSNEFGQHEQALPNMIEQLSGLAGIIEQKMSESNTIKSESLQKEMDFRFERQQFQFDLSLLKRDFASKEKELTEMNQSLTQEVKELNFEIDELGDERDQIIEAYKKLNDQVENMKQVGMLAGVSFLKGSEAKELMQLGSLLLGGQVPAAPESSANQPKENEPEPELSTEQQQRKTTENEVIKWMKGLGEKQFLRFAHVVNAMMQTPEITERFLRTILKNDEKPEAETPKTEGE